MCHIKEQCAYIRKTNNLAKPAIKEEMISLFESVGHDISETRKILEAKFEKQERIIMWGIPVFLTAFGLFLKFV